MNSLKTTVDIFPFRASIKNKDAWEIMITLQNEGAKPVKISIEMDLPQQVTLSKVGLVKRYEKKIDSFKPGATLTLKEPVFLSTQSTPGNFTGLIRIAEHLNEYGYETSVYKKEILFRIVP